MEHLHLQHANGTARPWAWGHFTSFHKPRLVPARAGYLLFLLSCSNLREVSVHVEGEIGYSTREHVIVPTLIICLFIVVPKKDPCISCAKSMPNWLIAYWCPLSGWSRVCPFYQTYAPWSTNTLTCELQVLECNSENVQKITPARMFRRLHQRETLDYSIS